MLQLNLLKVLKVFTTVVNHFKLLIIPFWGTWLRIYVAFGGLALHRKVDKYEFPCRLYGNGNARNQGIRDLQDFLPIFHKEKQFK